MRNELMNGVKGMCSDCVFRASGVDIPLHRVILCRFKSVEELISKSTDRTLDNKILVDFGTKISSDVLLVLCRFMYSNELLPYAQLKESMGITIDKLNEAAELLGISTHESYQHCRNRLVLASWFEKPSAMLLEIQRHLK
jgi:hypothetical protein